VPSIHDGFHWTASFIKETAVVQGNAENVYKICVHMNTFMMWKETRDSIDSHYEDEVRVQNTVF
jgi:hypothetical protein